MGIDALSSALSGLNAAQSQLSVIAGNVSNAGTAGYTRKILPQETATVLGQTSGVLTDPVTRDVNLELEGEFWTQQSSVSALNTQVSYLGQIQSFNGSSDSESNIGAQITDLSDAFTSLANDPSNANLQTSVVTAAQGVTSKLNSFSTLITTMRNQTQDDIASTVTDINDKLQEIAKLNSQIKFNQAAGQTTAALEDNRDQLVSGLSQDVGVSYFIRSDGVMVVQTSQGVQLADTTAQNVSFSKTQLSATSAYPGTAGAITVSPISSSSQTIDITQSNLGGQLGALVSLRDTTLPQQQASLDELSEQLATRFDQQGLTLFTNAAGKVPANTAPNPNTSPPTPVPYVGFSAEIQVNPAVVANNALVQQGTAVVNPPVQSGSDEVIQRVVNNALGAVQHQEADGTVNLNDPPNADLQSYLGIYSSAQVTGSTDASNYSTVSALMADGGENVFHTTSGPPYTDQFSVTFSETRGAAPPGTMTVNVSLSQAGSDFAMGSTYTDAVTGASVTIKSAGDQIAEEINKQIAAQTTSSPNFVNLAAVASTNSYGQLTLSSHGSIDVESSGTGAMGQAGLNYLGLTAGVTATTDPYISVQVGDNNPVQVSIAPGDTSADLLAKLNNPVGGGVPGLGASIDPVTGELTLMPGDSTTNPLFGGSLTILGGPFTSVGSASGSTGTTSSGTSIVAALFGSDSPVIDVGYGDAKATDGASDFRQDNLGPQANLSTGAISNGSVIDYAQQLLVSQANTYNAAKSGQTDESTYTTQLQTTLQNNDGVNIDQELSNMIVVQTAYSASARVISTIQSEFQTLLQAFQG